MFVACCTPSHSIGTEYQARAFSYPNTVDIGEIQEAEMKQAFDQFAGLASTGAKKITLRINSPGGSIFLGFDWVRAVEDLKKANDIDVTCVVDGMAYSMAAVILQSDLCDHRLATSRSTILFYNGSGVAQGTSVDMKGTASFLDALNEAMAMVVSDRLKMPIEEYQQRIANGDWVMAGREAFVLNVIDGLVRSSDIAPPVR